MGDDNETQAGKESPFQCVERLSFGAGTVIDSRNAHDAVQAAYEDWQEFGTNYLLVVAHPSGSKSFPTFILIDGELYQLDKTEYQPTGVSDDKKRTVNIFNCGSCGGDHDQITLRPLPYPVEENGCVWLWTARCPVTGNGLLVRDVGEGEG